jgi:hypothetical protein
MAGPRRVRGLSYFPICHNRQLPASESEALLNRISYVATLVATL